LPGQQSDQVDCKRQTLPCHIYHAIIGNQHGLMVKWASGFNSRPCYVYAFFNFCPGWWFGLGRLHLDLGTTTDPATQRTQGRLPDKTRHQGPFHGDLSTSFYGLVGLP
jgi:hypothetical protein